MTLTTPDQRYIIVKGRLWRAANPNLPADVKDQLVHDLMDSRRAVKVAQNTKDPVALKQARRAVNTAKIALGERGQGWWTDGTPDYNRHLVKNTPYAAWFAQALKESSASLGSASP